MAPVYSQTALDTALRIARGDWRETGIRISVSPESIRRSMKLLEDMGIAETRHTVELRRSIGYAIQQITLFPNTTVRQTLLPRQRCCGLPRRSADKLYGISQEPVDMAYEKHVHKHPRSSQAVSSSASVYCGHWGRHRPSC